MQLLMCKNASYVSSILVVFWGVLFCCLGLAVGPLPNPSLVLVFFGCLVSYVFLFYAPVFFVFFFGRFLGQMRWPTEPRARP